ncbi:cell wall-binding repeat-containing protein [Leifsonia shinshuensis]|uniref:cell wall-binding repeat-containing protein n=1 Tax=Leifsonia shinshuensis TaxID=150026 RepID=UPI0028678E17|nr:cell wall-binding repeat-containing protein [Leifsonia shinshuensis]MDR6973242.1 putative cell wall-binding protein [Leifsonia shinshuensis]
MVLGGMRARTRALVTAVLAATLAALALTATGTPAAADDGAQADAYYAAVAKASAGRAATPEQENANVAAALGGVTARGGLQPFAAADADPSKFIDGDLASDAVFFNGTAWNETQIQTFLNSKVATCAGTNPTCLKSYTTATVAKAADAECNGYAAAASQNAAHIIATVATSCGINPVVLIVLLQKEQGLVTSTAPTQDAYDFATGWNCPDTDLGCSTNDADTTGFFNQVYGAAWQFKRYGVGTDFDWFPVGKVSPVRYNLDAGCGSKQVAIQNKATAALYYYTPYTPNQASLDSYPGEGDDCSAYGIRNFWMLFNAWYGSSTAGSVPSSQRVSGADRFFTAAAISQAAFPSPTPGTLTVFVANGLDFPDALAAAPAAAKAGGPLLLTMPGAVPAATFAELQRLKPAKIYVAGGPAVITQAVLDQLATVQAGQSVERIYGGSRFDTSIQISEKIFGTSAGAHTAYLASGLGFPDALSAGGAAGAHGQPVILVNGGLTAADQGTVDALVAMGITSVKIVGGTSIISPDFEASLRNLHFTVTRVWGSDRFATSMVVNQDAFGGSPTPAAYFASGTTFPDALAGAAWAGGTHSPLLVTQAGCLYAGSAEIALRSPALTTLGGAAALGDKVGALQVCQ